MCQRRLLRRVERHSPDKAESTVVLYRENRSEHFTQNLLEKRSGHYKIALEEIEGYIADQKTVEDEIEARELARIIEEFLDTLTVENRVIFMRRYWFADSYKDIAELVGISEKNISVRLTRIREKMKQYLIEREVFV
jgi:RNA polymerase sigma factor (sigma-70 family)